MAETQRVPLFIRTPAPPASQQDLVRWAREVTVAMSQGHILLARRLEEFTLQGTTAQRPTADGSRRFFWDETTSKLYYDDGVWSEVGV